MTNTLIRFACMVATATFSALVLNACGPGLGPAPQPTNRMARVANTSLDTIKIGHQLYEANCVQCHTGTPPKPPVDRAWHPASLNLNLYNQFTAEQRYAILEYVRSVEAVRFKSHDAALNNIR